MAAGEMPAEQHPAVVVLPCVAEAGVLRELGELQEDHKTEGRGGRRPRRGPQELQQGVDPQREEDQQEALVEHIPAHVDPVPDPGRREEDREGEAREPSRLATGDLPRQPQDREEQSDDRNQQTGREHHARELGQGGPDAPRQRPRHFRVVGVGERPAVVGEPPGDERGQRGQAHGCHGQRRVAPPAQGEIERREKGSDEAVGPGQAREDGEKDQGEEPPVLLSFDRPLHGDPERHLEGEHERGLQAGGHGHPQGWAEGEGQSGQSGPCTAQALPDESEEAEERCRGAEQVEADGDGQEAFRTGQPGRRDQEQHVQEVGVALHPFARVEHQPVAGDQVLGIAVGDEGVVAPRGVPRQVGARRAPGRLEQASGREEDEGRGEEPPSPVVLMGGQGLAGGQD